MSSRKRARTQPTSQPAPAAAAAAAASSSSVSPASGSASPAGSASASDAFASPTLLSAAAAASVVFGVSTAVALSEFRRFVTLKAFVSDTDATVLSPTPLMDHMWHAAILDTKLYRQMQTQIGLTMDHSPAGASMDPAATAARLKRLETMRVVYRAKYREDPIESGPVAISEAAAAAASARARAAVPLRQVLHVTIKDLLGREEKLQIRSDALVSDFMTACSEQTGVPEYQQRLIFAGRQLDPRNTLADYGLEDGSMVHMVLHLRGC